MNMPFRCFLLGALLSIASTHASHAQQDVLFVGNSFTNGFVAPTLNYNAANITDANGTGMGGVPGIFKALATAGGHSVNVTIESANGSMLSEHYATKQAIIGQSKWEWVVLQDLSVRPLSNSCGETGGGNLPAFRDAVLNLRNLVLNANPSAKILLYETWARPNLVPAYYPTMQATQNELYSAYSDATIDFGLFGWAPVGDAFMNAITAGVADDPKISGTQGPVSLWYTDGQHASTYGSYLSALTFYAKILGDPRTIPTGSGSVAAALSLNSTYASQLATIAWNAAQQPPMNRAPITNAGPDRYTEMPGGSLNLDGSVLDDGLPLNAPVTGSWSKVSGPGSVTFSSPSSIDTGAVFTQAGTYVLRLTGGDGTLSSTDDVTVRVYPGPARFAINCGSNSSVVSLDDGVTYIADAYWTGGTKAAGTAYDIPNSLDEALLAGYHYSTHSYNFPLANGTYNVMFKFADNATAAGTRVFNVGIEGVTKLSNFDIFAAGGKNMLVERDFNVTLTDGQLNIQFTNVMSTAKINAIIIRSVASVGNLAPNAAADGVTINEGTSVTIPVLSNDSDSDGPSPISISSVGTPTGGTATISGSQIQYTPAAGFYGTDTFTYSITDGTASAEATVTVVVVNTATANHLNDAGLTGTAIGSGVSGSARVLANGQWEVNGIGAALAAGTADAVYYQQKSMTGNFQAVLRMRSLTGNSAARAGLMLREGTGANARTVFLATSPSGGVYVYGSRTTAGGASTVTTSSTAYNYANAWLMLEREGTSIKIAVSTDDITYTQLGTVALSSLAGSVNIGPFVTGGNGVTPARAVMTDFQVGNAQGVVLAINCGKIGGAAQPFVSVDDPSITYAVDSGYNNNLSVNGATFAVGNTNDDELFASYRYGTHSYTIPNIPSGNYEIIFRFCDGNPVGHRKFAVAVEGATLLNEYDIRAEAGYNNAINKPFPITVTDGTLNIQFTNGTMGTAKINAIVLKTAP